MGYTNYNAKENKYEYFVTDGRCILSGWTHKEDAQDFKKDYEEFKEIPVKIYTTNHMIKIGLDPNVNDNWGGG